MSDATPDWLTELMPGAEEEPPVGQEEAGAADMMTDLRGQMDEAGAEEALEKAPRPRSSRSVFGGLRPWQRFVLSILMFLDVAIIGLLFLVMLGRVVIP